MFKKLKENQFLFEQLVFRDFKQKYKRTVLGVIWSVLYPLLHLFVLVMVFTKLLGRSTPHYTIYVFCGTLIMSFFRESTKNGMRCLIANKGIITKVKIPKYFFLLSNNVSSLINFGLTLIVFIIFCLLDHLTITWEYLLLLYPIGCLVVFNIGVGLSLSAWFVFFRDTSYLYDIFLTLLNYLSVVFYRIDRFSERGQRLFLLNPVYCYIKYFRDITLENTIPSIEFHLLCAFYALIMFGVGAWYYKKYNHKFLYYM